MVWGGARKQTERGSNPLQRLNFLSKNEHSLPSSAAVYSQHTSFVSSYLSLLFLSLSEPKLQSLENKVFEFEFSLCEGGRGVTVRVCEEGVGGGGGRTARARARVCARS